MSDHTHGHIGWGTPDLPTTHRMYVAPLPEMGRVETLTAEANGWRCDIFASLVADWADPYYEPAHIDSVQDLLCDFARQTHATEDIDDATGWPFASISDRPCIIIIQDRMTADELGLPDISRTVSFALSEDGDVTGEVHFRLSVCRVWCRECQRHFTAVVGEPVQC